MNILFLSQRVPYPPNKGDKLRSFNEISFLSQKHRISLVCLADNAKDLKHAKELHSYCQSIDIVFLPKLQSKLQSVLAIVTKKPLTLSYFFSRDLKAIVDRKLQEEKYDVIFVYCSSMAQYVEHVQYIPKVIDFVDVDSEKWSQYAMYASFPMKYLYHLESRRLRNYEALIAESFQHSFFVSETETRDFKNLVSQSPAVTPILNGVDCEMFKPAQEPYNPHSLVFTGAMDYFANVEAVRFFAREILPLIIRNVPDVKFYVVGSNPAKEIVDLGKKHPNILVTGYVDSVRPYVVNSAVFVAPMRIARGVQNKILEAMAMGVPVVTTTLGFEGISARPGRDIFVEDLPESFAKQVIHLMQDNRLRREISENSRRSVERFYNWSMNLEKLEFILVEILRRSMQTKMNV